MRWTFSLVAMTACSFSGGAAENDVADASTDAPVVDASPDAMTDGALGTLIETFEEGEDNYVGTRDTTLSEGSPTTAFGGDQRVVVDSRDAGQNTALWGALRFRGIFAANGGPVPDGAIIDAAVLTVNMRNSGDQIDLRDALVEFTEASVWDDFGDPVSSGSASAQIVDSVPQRTIGAFELDVTTSLASWSIDPSASFGWFIAPTARDGAEIAARENDNNRPRLKVTYRP